MTFAFLALSLASLAAESGPPQSRDVRVILNSSQAKAEHPVFAPDHSPSGALPRRAAQARTK